MFVTVKGLGWRKRVQVPANAKVGDLDEKLEGRFEYYVDSEPLNRETPLSEVSDKEITALEESSKVSLGVHRETP